MILVAQDIGEHLEAVAFLDQAHRDAGHRRLDRHSGVHQREARAANGGHGTRSVGLEDFRYDADDVGKVLHIRHDGLDAALGEVAVADLAPLRRAHHAGLADAERREVVVQHERLFALAGQAVDDLRIAPGAERRDHQRLRLAAGEERRAVGSRQHAGADRDRTDGFGVAAVDARMPLEDALAHQPILEIEELPATSSLVNCGELPPASASSTAFLISAIFAWRCCFSVSAYAAARSFSAKVATACFRSTISGAVPRPLRLAGLGREFVDRLDRGLHLFVTEHDGAEHDFLIESLRLGLDHQHAFDGAGDHEIELRLAELRRGGIEDVAAVLVADSRRTDRAEKGHAGNRERRGGADQRCNVRVDFGIDRKHRGHDLHVVGEAFRKQRTDGSVDQARGQRLFLGGPTFAFEEAAGNASRGIGLLLIVDRERKEIPARRRLFETHRGHENDGIAHGHEYRAVGLTRKLAGFDRYGVVTILKTFLGMAHVGCPS